MGNNKRAKNDRRKKFNSPRGKNSYKYKVECKKAIYNKAKKIENYTKEKLRFPPYQIVNKQVVIDGRICTKFSVRSIPIHKDRQTRVLSVGNSSLKLYFKRPSAEQLTGNRIINLDLLKRHVVEITLHTAVCETAKILAQDGEACLSLESETKQNGLYSVLGAVCKGCRQQFKFETSSRNSSTNIADVNLRAVWGTISTGGGCSGLQELFGTLNMPSINQRAFTSIESNIGKWWESVFKEEIVKAGIEERRLAIERGDLHDGIPAITVICDGGWSKRAHKHTYNASGGVAVIFGAVTKKLLYLGVRNKYCYICARGQTGTVKDHICYKNWSESSQSMESDMILEGFLEAESLHGVRYMKVIADGDSSVYSKIVENVPVWGPKVQKLECANHACKCLRSNLEKLVQEKPEYKGKGKLTKHARVRLTTAVRCAIKMRSSECNAKQLKKDIKNSVYHLFGFHENCSNFCKKCPNKNTVTEPDSQDNDTISNDCDDLFGDQAEFWHVASDDELDESRFAGQTTSEDVKNIIKDVSVYLNRLAEKSNRLIGNFTTNLAESWMNIRCKFDGGKTVNRCNRGSWQTRCIGGALRKNLGPAWSPITYQRVTDVKPGQFFIKTFRQKSKHLAKSLHTQRQEKAKTQRRKRKQQCLSQPSKKAKLDYGPSVLNDTKDIPAERLQQLTEQFYRKVVKKTSSDIDKIEKSTKDQSLCNKWLRERKIRLTSSNFGQVIKRRNGNTSTNLVKNMLYTTFKGTMFTVRGLAQEANTVIEYQNCKPCVKTIEKMGLVIAENKPFLAASTDGKVTQHDGEIGLLEVKNLLHTKKDSFKQASEHIPNFCLEQDKNGALHLKKDHNYYYQCQGQLNIFQMPWLDFVVRRTDPYEIHIERIFRDSELWEVITPKLEAFYEKFILPELVFPRHGTVSGIRQPQSPWYVDSSERKISRRRAKKSVILCNKKNCKVIQCNKTNCKVVQCNKTNCKVIHCNKRNCKLNELELPNLNSPSTRDESPELNLPSTSASLPKPSTSHADIYQQSSESDKLNELELPNLNSPSTRDESPELNLPSTSASLPKPSTSHADIYQQSSESDKKQGRNRRRRNVCPKFIGRRISHEWCVDESTKETQWFKGTVLDVKKGKDGTPSAIYEVLYEGEDEVYEVEKLNEDLQSGSLSFIDL